MCLLGLTCCGGLWSAALPPHAACPQRQGVKVCHACRSAVPRLRWVVQDKQKAKKQKQEGGAAGAAPAGEQQDGGDAAAGGGGSGSEEEDGKVEAADLD